MTDRPLKGRRILLVEDEFFQARETKSILEEAGAEVVGPAGHAADVPDLLEGSVVDAALIDINLGGGPDFAVAEALLAQGVPFMFVTGYSGTVIPSDYAAVPRVEKPARDTQVLETLASLTTQRHRPL